MRRELTTEEKRWCLEQAIAMVKEVGHGGAASMREAATHSQGSTTPSAPCTKQCKMMRQSCHRQPTNGVTREEAGETRPPVALTGIEPVSSA